jgi:hypothetical protein
LFVLSISTQGWVIMDFQGHFQQYFDYIMVGSFIERENRCTLIDKTRDLPKVTHKRYMIFKIKKDELFQLMYYQI